MPKVPSSTTSVTRPGDADNRFDTFTLSEYEQLMLQHLFEQFERRCPAPHLVLLAEEGEYLALRAKFF